VHPLAAQRDDELIADLSSECPRLGKATMAVRPKTRGATCHAVPVCGYRFAAATSFGVQSRKHGRDVSSSPRPGLFGGLVWKVRSAPQ
jgi:hypothetical protein